MPDAPEEPCYCDSPLCEKNWICKELGELRIAYKVLKNLKKHQDVLGVTTVDDALSHIEFECEILCK